MTTRLDAALRDHQDREGDVRLLASRDPSGNLKYLHWAVKVLASGQALAPEIADVVESFHRLSPVRAAHLPHGRVRRRDDAVRPDLSSYAPGEFAALRGRLAKLQRAVDRKKRERERLYRIEGPVRATVVFESEDLVVRHVENKAASVHYGLQTKWCTAMKAEDYFDDYDSQNTVLFYLERKAKRGDAFDKSALVIERDLSGAFTSVTVFSSLDERQDVLSLAEAYGYGWFEALRPIFDRARAHPGSVLSRVFAGSATAQDLEQALALTTSKFVERRFGSVHLIEAICCNPSAPWPLLQRVYRKVLSSERSRVRRKKRVHTYYRRHMGTHPVSHLVEAALFAHPETPAPEREALGKRLRRRHVRTDTVRVDIHRREGVSVTFAMRGERETTKPRRRYRRHRFTLSQQERHVGVVERCLARLKRKLARAKAEAAAKAAKARAKTKKAKKGRGR